MSFSTFELVQAIDERSVGRAGFSVEGGKAEELYRSTAPVSFDDLGNALLEILGDVEAGDDGKLQRTLPLAHPIFPWLMASDVQVRWIGAKDGIYTSGTDSADETLEVAPITDLSYNWVRVELLVSFTPRPYKLLKDDSISPASTSYYQTDGSSSTYTDSKEYLRYVVPNLVRNTQIASAQHGQLVFRTSGGAEPGDTPRVFSGFPYIVLPDGRFTVTWFMVPYSLFDDVTHPMWTMIGSVNQSSFFGHAAGKLLYKGPDARPYTPVVPTFEVDSGTTVYTNERLVDITFDFEYTGRAATDPPDLSGTNASWVLNGHNAQPYWKKRKFYAVTEPGSSASDKIPLFPSAPMQRLFEVPAP